MQQSRWWLTITGWCAWQTKNNETNWQNKHKNNYNWGCRKRMDAPVNLGNISIFFFSGLFNLRSCYNRRRTGISLINKCTNKNNSGNDISDESIHHHCDKYNVHCLLHTTVAHIANFWQSWSCLILLANRVIAVKCDGNQSGNQKPMLLLSEYHHLLNICEHICNTTSPPFLIFECMIWKPALLDFLNVMIIKSSHVYNFLEIQ